MAKVLLVNGSPHRNGCTALALDEMIRVFHREGVETELLQAGSVPMRGCLACGQCRKKHRRLPAGRKGKAMRTRP